MQRILVLLFALLVLTVPVAAQEQAPDEGDAGPPGDAQPSLPEQASSTARQVLDTVFTFTADVFDSVGAALQNLLGGGSRAADGQNGSNG